MKIIVSPKARRSGEWTQSMNTVAMELIEGKEIFIPKSIDVDRIATYLKKVFKITLSIEKSFISQTPSLEYGYFEELIGIQIRPKNFTGYIIKKI